ncbi:hypothetical protein GGS21DRAFT_544687 [Xylaria nigripes]|nr:hypothetical protein GGS21DRAFT_544687 [Xylaria nigripes]
MNVLANVLRTLHNFIRAICQLYFLSRPERILKPYVSLLMLPNELINLILEYLEPIDRAVLSQTCRSLRYILGEEARPIHFSHKDFLKFLIVVARNEPERWVCGKCTCLHRMIPYDTPASRRYQRLPCNRYSKWLILVDTCFEGRKFWLRHQHVQLAIKHTRLQLTAYQQYLHTLVKPHIYICALTTPFASTGWQTVNHAMYPRITSGNDGEPRFLLYSVWHYFKEDGDDRLRISKLEPQLVCPHLHFGLDHDITPNPLTVALRYAYKNGINGQKQDGACIRCATDYTIWYNRGDVLLQIWRDLGTESSPFNITWTSQTIKGRLEDDVEDLLSTPWSGPILDHEPGSFMMSASKFDRKIRRKWLPEPGVLRRCAGERRRRHPDSYITLVT